VSEEPKWINCKEEMPTKDMNVYVVNNRWLNFGRIARYSSREGVFLVKWPEINEPIPFDATHWFALPQTFPEAS